MEKEPAEEKLQYIDFYSSLEVIQTKEGEELNFIGSQFVPSPHLQSHLNDKDLISICLIHRKLPTATYK